MIGLLDVNVLIALFDAAHVHHRSAHAWIRANRTQGSASCPITQNGCVRVMSQPSYPGYLSVAEIVRRLAVATATRKYTFWPDSTSICDRAHFAAESILIPRSLTDVYLLALAVKHAIWLCFDQSTVRSIRSNSPNDHAWKGQPAGLCGGSPSAISEM